MCLGIPAKIINVTNDNALVEFQGVKRECSVLLLPEAKEGDWVIMHAGFAIERLDEEAAAETLQLIGEIMGVESGIENKV